MKWRVEISTRRDENAAILRSSGVFLFTIHGNHHSGRSSMHSIGRRQVLAGAGAAVLLGGLEGCVALGPRQAGAAPLQLAPVRASTDRITRITVCTRPFRAAGPRLDAEQVGSKLVVHNYGHGGSGWSLSWGSSSIAIRKALAGGDRDIAVIGCGALGLTSALLLQRAGARVTIYAKDLPPNVRSSWATGLWTPDSRICLEQNATPEFKQQWQEMARTSYQTYQSFLGLSDAPVEYIDEYFVSDEPLSARRREPADNRPRFAALQEELLPDLVTRGADFAPGAHSLGRRYLRRNSLMMFNLSAYTRLLVHDFRENGGRIEIAEFRTPDDFSRISQKTLINATGYGARALFGDQSLTPVRGQLARVIPQPEVSYGLFYKGVSLVPRRDGLVFQVVGNDDYYGFNDETAVADRGEADHAVTTIAGLFANTAASA
jgi:glycine/D-amino acid oxidase-like deaminating enzyme